MNPPEIELGDHNSRIQYLSELSEVFDKEDLQRAFDKVVIKEKMLHPKDKIVGTGENFGKILYVARGVIIEKDGDLDDFLIPQLKFQRGNIACLQNLLPYSESDLQISDVYCHSSSIVSVIPLDLEYLKYILTKDNTKLLKLWNILVYRLVIIHQQKLKVLQ